MVFILFLSHTVPTFLESGLYIHKFQPSKRKSLKREDKVLGASTLCFSQDQVLEQHHLLPVVRLL